MTRDPPLRFRWTVDTEEDFAFAYDVYATLYPNKPDFGLDDILGLAGRASRPGAGERGGVSVRLRRLQRADGLRGSWPGATRRTSPFYMYGDHVIDEAEHALWLDAALKPARPPLLDRRAGRRARGPSQPRPHRPRRRKPQRLGLLPGRSRCAGARIGRLQWNTWCSATSSSGSALNKLWCEVLAVNIAVVRLHERFGFTREALFRDHVRKGGLFHDVVGMGLLRREWPDIRAAAEAQLSRTWLLSGLTLEG